MRKELIEQLRDLANCRHDDLSIGYEAADRIEQLEREVFALKISIGYEAADHIEQLEREVFALKTPCAVALVALEDFNEQSKRQGIFLPAEIDFAIDRLREALAKGRKP